MEALTRLVTDSLARHGFDRPVDPRRLQWSRWFRCDSTHSLLVVPSKPGIFALAEEIMDLGTSGTLGASKTHVGTAALGCPAEQSSAVASTSPTPEGSTDREGHDFNRAVNTSKSVAALAAGVPTRRMLAVLQFSEDDDMAFTLDRMFGSANPMRTRFASGRCFLRFVVIDDQAQRRSICSALNQWMLSSAEKASGIPAGFSSSLEFSALSVPRAPASLSADSATLVQPDRGTDVSALPHLNSGANKNLHCPHPLPSGF